MSKSIRWEITPFIGTYQLPKLLHEIRVKDWSLPLVGDYQGCIVAYVAGGNWDDPDAQPAARAHAELIASAPALKAEIERLRQENERLKARLRRERDYSGFLEEKHSESGEDS